LLEEAITGVTVTAITRAQYQRRIDNNTLRPLLTLDLTAIIKEEEEEEAGGKTAAVDQATPITTACRITASIDLETALRRLRRQGSPTPDLVDPTAAEVEVIEEVEAEVMRILEEDASLRSACRAPMCLHQARRQHQQQQPRHYQRHQRRCTSLRED
jgi:hypothetical protein